MNRLVKYAEIFEKRALDPMDVVQMGIGGAGFIPGYGEAADAANALISIGRGNYLEAALLLLSMIPIVGDVVGKGGIVAMRLAPDAAKAVKAVLKTDESQQTIEEQFAKAEENEELAPHVDKMKQALTDFIEEEEVAV
jgi:hypothetical protein